MQVRTKFVARLTAAIAIIAVGAIAYLSGISYQRMPEAAAMEGIRGVWEVSTSLIAFIWLAWGWRRRQNPADAFNRPEEVRRPTKKWAIVTTLGLVAATVGILSIQCNRNEATPVQVREFTGPVIDGAVISIALTWAIWYWIGKRGFSAAA
jgi:hypothetical protein